MTSKRFALGALLVGVLVAQPVFAQNARPRGERGGNRDSGEQRSGDRRGGEQRSRESRGSDQRVTQRAEAQDRGGRSYAPARAPEQRSYERRNDAPRNVQSPRVEAPRRFEAPQQPSRAPQQQYRAQRQYDAPRQYDNRRYENNRRYDNRSYSNRSYSRPYYTRPYSYNRRVYVQPYYAHRPYYGYRGYYGYGPGYRSTRIVTVVPWRPYYYRPHFSIGVFYGAGGAYAYGATPSYYYDPIPGRPYGGVRITNAPHEAQVFADGYYAGIVDDFDGVFQHVNLEAGQHRIEVRMPGTDEGISFDVYVQAGRTITLRADAYDDGYSGQYGDNGPY
jgi:hypothetical protein